MRTMNYKFNNGRGMKSILACLVAMVMGLALASCSSSDDKGNDPVTPVETDKLPSWWISAYDDKGTVPGDTEGEEIDYTRVLQVYLFREDGTGKWQKFFMKEGSGIVKSYGDIFAIQPGGDFTYTENGGKVSITLAQAYAVDASRSWEMTFADGKVIGKDGDISFEMTRTVDVQTAIDVEIKKMLGANSGSASANGYKPNVDHSKWMAPLADSRLVADLSLPGSHDACTAEGWWPLDNAVSEGTAKAQDLTISEQLKVGVRVFDLRPERVLNGLNHELRCSHGIMATKLLVKDFFIKLRDFLKQNPTEFCIVTCNLTNSNDPVGYSHWKKEFSELINSSDLSGLFAGFKPNITVGEVRGRVLLLSRYEYDGTIVGGICQNWSNDKKLENQTKGKIKAADGSEAPLWTQDYYSVGYSRNDLVAKDEAIRRMLDATAARDLTAAAPAWVFNYSAGYLKNVTSNHYRENATRTNRLVIDYLKNPLHNASTGIIYMDYAGMDKTPGYLESTVYETYGLQLVEALINQNFRTPGTIDASLFSVCTLNVDGLPAFDFVNNDGPDTEFTPVISRYLADKNFDFIGVQENFDFDPELGRCLIANYDHDSWAGGMSLDNLFNDGVYPSVFHTDGCKAWWHSHLKTVRTDSIRWNDRYGYDTHCRDEAATKGFRRYEITTTEGYQLVVYNMHMEASERWDEVGGTDDEDRAARLKQWIQLREHIFSKLDTRPVLVIGDFNTYYCRDDMKANFIDAINASGRATCGDAWIEKCRGGVYPALEEDKKIKDDGDWLGWTIHGEMPDKILYINPTGGHSVELLQCTYDNADNSRDYFKPSGFAADHEEPLGDHFPLFATFRLK